METVAVDELMDSKRNSKYCAGQQFNYWTLISPTAFSGVKWVAECICGKQKEVYIQHLKNGKSKSCSCKTKHTHSMTKSPEYNSWAAAKYRCTNSNDDRWKDYGGRGIKFCDRWLNSFEDFYADMGERPKNSTLDRIDTNGNYEPSNCKWSTAKEQANNTRIQLDNGYSIKELSEKCNIPYSRLQTRLKRGWSLDNALTIPYCKGRRSDIVNALSH